MKLSILIPTYNTVIDQLVAQLHTQCCNSTLQQWEIIVIDDASTDSEVQNCNSAIQQLTDTTYIQNYHNRGRSAIRNQLAQKAQFPWLLFIDADMLIPSPNYINNFIQAAITHPNAQVFCGHYSLKTPSIKTLRYLYEQDNLRHHNLCWRQKHPYRAFKACNTLIKRQLILQHPFASTIQAYGYEDLLLGELFLHDNIQILHINNPVLFHRFEDNATFLNKTDQSLRILADSRPHLSKLYNIALHLQRFNLDSIVLRYFKQRKNKWIKKLQGPEPNIYLFQAYKLATFLQILKNSNQTVRQCDEATPPNSHS